MLWGIFFAPPGCGLAPRLSGPLLWGAAGGAGSDLGVDLAAAWLVMTALCEGAF